MRIQSIYKDYYDSGLSYGIDTDIFYLRKHYNLQRYYSKSEIGIINAQSTQLEVKKFNTFVEKIKQIKLHRNRQYEVKSQDEKHFLFSFNSLFLGFQLIHFVRVVQLSEKYNSFFDNNVVSEEFIYNERNLKDYLLENKINKKGTHFLNTNIVDRFNEYIDLVEKEKNKYEFIFKLYDTPIFLLRNYEGNNDDIEIQNNKEEILPGIIINPVLKNIKLKKVINPYECFQEISMFLTYLHNPEEEIKVEKMDDNIKRDSHGFNKCSFKSCSRQNK